MLSSTTSLDDIRTVPTAIAQRPSLPPYHAASASSTVSEGNHASADPKKKNAIKRKRTQDGTSDSTDSSSQPSRTREGPKKKKANRACASCQKAHLTCDDCTSHIYLQRVIYYYARHEDWLVLDCVFCRLNHTHLHSGLFYGRDTPLYNGRRPC
ncbi:hypothetical protein DAEQUDRAFT_156603 [Daedalea quercina L-15889]|uniref:Zn(2)-C6 fungal-type domain-containing protein n=1 Tax=Daedalea quercina L-15889 TaxID=1314783 RepID=A0A165RPS0_9APHY|nr:hypothetical protein DAEQUDRAFT_156603 [Daedalea quercina L-15889]